MAGRVVGVRALWLAVPGAAPPLPPGISEPHAAKASVAAVSAAARMLFLAIMDKGYHPVMVNEPETKTDKSMFTTT
jgi:hypothetical protein